MQAKIYSGSGSVTSSVAERFGRAEHRASVGRTGLNAELVSLLSSYLRSDYVIITYRTCKYGVTTWS